MSNDFNRAALLTGLEEQRTQLLALLSQFSDEQWRGVAREDGWAIHDIAVHVADSTYGLALIALGEGREALPTDPTSGQVSPHDFNEYRRQKNRELPREKLMSRMVAAFAAAQRALETVEDLDTPVNFGEGATKGRVLQRIVEHLAEHQGELQASA